MGRSKKIFAAFALAFIVILTVVMIDMGRRTTFPWNRTNDPARLDTIQQDSVR